VAVYNQYYPDSSNQINTPGSATRLVREGPTIPVTISLIQAHIDYLTKLGQPLPNPVSGLALIDTGATFCSIDESVLQALGVPPYGVTDVIGVSGPIQQPTYPAGLSFPGTPIPPIAFADFIGARLKEAGIIAIIGRNVLRDFVLVYNGPGGFVSLSF